MRIKTIKEKIVAGIMLLLMTSGASVFAQQSEAELSEYISSTKELTLDQAMQMALANNPQIKRALLAIDDADELVKIAYSEVLPEISSSINYIRNIEIPVSFLPAQIFDPTAPAGALTPVAFGTDNNWSGGFSVTQNLFKGEALVGISSSTVFKTVQEESFRFTNQQIITQARLAYYQVLIAKENVRLQEAQIERIESNLKDNQARFEAGLVEEYDVLRLQVQLSNQKPQLVETQYALEEAYRSLKVVLGVPLGFDFNVKGNLNTYDILGEAADADNDHILAIDNMNQFQFGNATSNNDLIAQDRGDVRVLDSQINLKDREITAIKSRFLPTLSANYNLLWTAAEPGAPNPFRNPEPFTNPIRSQTLGISLSLPIFNGLERLSNWERAKIQRKDLVEQKRETTLNALNEIATNEENLNKSFETSEARKEALSQAKRGYEIAKARFDNGLGSQLEVTEADTQVREAELNYATLIYNYLVAKAQYDLATGMVPLIDIKN